MSKMGTILGERFNKNKSNTPRKIPVYSFTQAATAT